MVDWSEHPARDMLAGGALAVASILVPFFVLVGNPTASIPAGPYFQGDNLDAGEPVWVVLLPVLVGLAVGTPLLAWRADMVDDEAMLDWFPFGRHVEYNFPVVLLASLRLVSLPLSTDLVLAVAAGLLPATRDMDVVITLAQTVPPSVVVGLSVYLQVVPYEEKPRAA